jgi:hypothetical protein
LGGGGSPRCQDAPRAIRRGELRLTDAPTLRDAAAELIDGMSSGAIQARRGRRYRASVIRKYEGILERYVLDDPTRTSSSA